MPSYKYKAVTKKFYINTYVNINFNITVKIYKIETNNKYFITQSIHKLMKYIYKCIYFQVAYDFI